MINNFNPIYVQQFLSPETRRRESIITEKAAKNEKMAASL